MGEVVKSFTLLAGAEEPSVRALPPFSDGVMEFLDALSRKIRAAGSGGEPEIAAFGFWCRRAHLLELKQRRAYGPYRLGRGLTFHVAPANVPALFAYSFAAGLLAGNANIVRVSQRAGPVTARLCALFRDTLAEARFAALRETNAILACDRSSPYVEALMARCDTAVVWGGDATVQALQRFPTKPGAEFLAFPDRRSMAFISQKALEKADGDTFRACVRGFYNDTYAMDQNACSSPRLVLWLRDGDDGVRERFWAALSEEAARRGYPSDAYRAARKYETACLAAMTEPAVGGVRRYGGNLLYVLPLKGSLQDPDAPGGAFGLFYEAEAEGIDGLAPFLTEKLQTLVCFGIDRPALAAYLTERGGRGVDRIVEIGRAAAFDPVWDGKDLIARLSREICVP